MAYREVSRMEIKEIIRRWQAGEVPGRIAFGTGLSPQHGTEVPGGGAG